MCSVARECPRTRRGLRCCVRSCVRAGACVRVRAASRAAAAYRIGGEPQQTACVAVAAVGAVVVVVTVVVVATADVGGNDVVGHATYRTRTKPSAKRPMREKQRTAPSTMQRRRQHHRDRCTGACIAGDCSVDDADQPPDCVGRGVGASFALRPSSTAPATATVSRLAVLLLLLLLLQQPQQLQQQPSPSSGSSTIRSAMRTVA